MLLSSCIWGVHLKTGLITTVSTPSCKSGSSLRVIGRLINRTGWQMVGLTIAIASIVDQCIWGFQLKTDSINPVSIFSCLQIRLMIWQHTVKNGAGWQMVWLTITIASIVDQCIWGFQLKTVSINPASTSSCLQIRFIIWQHTVKNGAGWQMVGLPNALASAINCWVGLFAMCTQRQVSSPQCPLLPANQFKRH